jgi:hypothetical protein
MPNPCDPDEMLFVANFVHHAVMPDTDSIQAFVPCQLADT